MLSAHSPMRMDNSFRLRIDSYADPLLRCHSIQEESQLKMAMEDTRSSRKLFRAIATDLHFWIPLSVLLGGFVLLDKLR